MKPSELFLEYVRVATSLPVVILILLLVYKAPLMEYVQSRGGMEIEVLGVKIRTSDLATAEALKQREAKIARTANEMARGVQEAAASGDTSRGEPLLSAGPELPEAPVPVMGGPAGAVSRVQMQSDQINRLVKGTKFEEASRLEAEGFDHLVNGAFEKALQNFEAAWEIYPDFHNVAEIRELLREEMPALVGGNDPEAARDEVYGTILRKYAWGMPRQARERMTASLKEGD